MALRLNEGKTLDDFLDGLTDSRKDKILAFHRQYENRIYAAKGSTIKHQAWSGGYADHLADIMRIAEGTYELFSQTRKLPFSLESALIVLYFHDIEKPFKYTEPVEHIDPKKWLFEVLNKEHGIKFTDEEENALTYIHGEGAEYDPNIRIQNPLAAFCHCCDTTSARIFHDVGKGQGGRRNP
jgi:hypothetical protein